MRRTLLWLGIWTAALAGIPAPPVRADERKFARLHKEGNELYNRGDFRGARAKYEEALRIKRDPFVHFNLGNALFQLGELRAAAGAYESALSGKKEFPQAALNLGNVRFRLGDHRGALKALGRAASGPETWQLRAACLEVLGDDTGMLFALRQYALFAPDDLGARRAVGSLLYRMRRYPEAALELEYILTKAPADTRTLRLLAWTRIGLGENTKAVEALELVLRLSAKPDPAVLRALADLYAAEGLPREAARLLLRTTEGSDFATLMRAARLFLSAGETKSAEQTLERALTLRADAHEAHLLLGELRLARGDLEEARKSFQKAAKSRSRRIAARARSGLGTLAERRGDPDGALGFYRQAMKTDPSFPAPLTAAGKLRFASGDWDAAAERFRAALELDPSDTAVSRLLDMALDAARE
jgi:tetratricopeptide (TPR) repeat protein